LAIASKKQQDKSNTKEQIDNTLKLFYDVFKTKESKVKE
jgi:hypothetical protein